MIVVPAPRAIDPAGSSEFRPATVRVENNTVNTQPISTSAPTIMDLDKFDLATMDSSFSIFWRGGGNSTPNRCNTFAFLFPFFLGWA
jgi:hypothetical protein